MTSPNGVKASRVRGSGRSVIVSIFRGRAVAVTGEVAGVGVKAADDALDAQFDQAPDIP